MRQLALSEEDEDLFNSQVNRTLYTVYRDNIDKFSHMWEQQGPDFWLKFCISLRSVLQRDGFSIQLSAFELNHFEDFFVDLAKLLTGKSVESVHTYVKDVVGVSRYHQLMNNVPCKFVVKEIKVTTAFERLFGSPLEEGNVTKMCGTLPLHLRAIGCLLQLLKRWLVAEIVDGADKTGWNPPESWHYGHQLRASHFELYLKKQWNVQLLKWLNLRAVDICWWNALPKGDKICKVQQRNCELGCFISAMCKNLDSCDSKAFVKDEFLEDEMIFHYFVISCPRGKFKIFSVLPIAAFFQTSVCRGLYFVDSISAFHPLSQVIIGFTNAAFAFNFWYGGKGLETQLVDWEEKYELLSRGAAPPMMMLDRQGLVNFMLNIIAGHQVRAHIAATLNSNFYDTLYGNITWTSPISVIRLPWNIPLLINWLELLLIQIYEFQRSFVPLCHFPLRSSVVFLVENLYRKVSEAEFLVKTCIIIADGILLTQKRCRDLCYEPRKLLFNIIPRLNQTMKFFESDAYKILNVILKTGWSKEEKEDGENCLLATDRIRVDLQKWHSVPDVDNYYCENFRHIGYWVGSRDWPNIEGGREFHREAIELLKNYKPGKTSQEKKIPYKFPLFKERAQAISQNFSDKIDRPSQRLFVFVNSILKLLVEDGWLSSGSEENFWPSFDHHYDLELVESQLDKKSNGTCKEAIKYLKDIENYGAMYYVAASLLGDTWQCKIAGQNAFAKLQRNETYAVMADSGAKLCAIVQKVNPKIIECPPAQYFRTAAKEISNHTDVTSHLTIEDALHMLKDFEKEAAKKIDIDTSEALTFVKVPELEEMQTPSVGTNWLLYLEKKRMHLLQLVCEEQFTVTQSYIKKNFSSGVELFPLYNVLEYRLVEEMAAMQKCLEMGGLYNDLAYGLCRLLAHRFSWLQQSFMKWKKGKHKVQTPNTSLRNKADLREKAINIKIRMLAALIPLQGLFYTYISKFRTTHPITEMTIDMFTEWTDKLHVWSVLDSWNIIASCMIDYVDALEHMGYEYIEKMLEHCCEVWVVEPFCSDPEVSCRFGSIRHAEQILSTFTQLFLMCYHTLLKQNPKHPSPDITEKIEQSLINVNITLRKLELNGTKAISVAWPEARQEIKKELRSIWSDLLKLKNYVHLSTVSQSFPYWYGNEESQVWKEFFKIFVSSKYRNILQKIAFSEFINTKDPEPETATNESVQNDKDKNKSVTVKTVSSNHIKVTVKTVSSNHVKDQLDNNNIAGKKVQEDAIIKEKLDETKKPNNAKHLKQNSVQFQNNDEEFQRKLRVCAYCKKVEPVRKTYKKCSLCKKQNWTHPRFYCSQECQVQDWTTKHSMEHSTGEVAK
ncbi:uncharacterized protein [Periplaneta americana]